MGGSVSHAAQVGGGVGNDVGESDGMGDGSEVGFDGIGVGSGVGKNVGARDGPLWSSSKRMSSQNPTELLAAVLAFLVLNFMPEFTSKANVERVLGDEVTKRLAMWILSCLELSSTSSLTGAQKLP